MGDLASRRKLAHQLKLRLGLIRLVELSQKHSSFVMESCRLWQITESDVDDFKPKPVIFVVHAGVHNEDIELLVLWRPGGAFPHRCQCFLRLRVSDVRLRQQILNVDAVLSSAA